MSLAFDPVQPAMGKQTTLPQRNALRLLHTGALYRAGNGNWYGRAFPAQAVRNDTLQALVARGLARIETYQALYEERACAVLTPAGHAERCGVRLTSDRPPPVAVETVLLDVESALKALDAESATLKASMLRESEAMRDTRRRLVELEAFCARGEKRLAQIETARETIDRRRTELRCLVAHAAERVSESLQEGER